ncbi:Uncharacterised protein [Pragia fontium]|nr:Uncharacterised protein [Pragia fontium]VEJ55674.1 Uncharacterised protein [Pragia fontium]
MLFAASNDLALNSQGEVDWLWSSCACTNAAVSLDEYLLSICKLAMRCAVQTSTSRQANIKNHFAIRCC